MYLKPLLVLKSTELYPYTLPLMDYQYCSMSLRKTLFPPPEATQLGRFLNKVSQIYDNINQINN